MNCHRWLPLMSVMALGWAAPGHAAPPSPTRCIAIWKGPSSSCILHQSIQVEAVGKTEPAARKLAVRRLMATFSALREAHTLGVADGMASLVLAATDSCEDVIPEETVFTCFPEPTLLEARYCRVLVPPSRCVSHAGFSVEGNAWTHGERAREELCLSAAEDTGYLEGDPSSALTCEATCWQASKLECGVR